MTYKFNPQQHSTKIKAGMKAAKQAGKKLGRPKGGKIKGEDEVLEIYQMDREQLKQKICHSTYEEIANIVGVSKGTVQRIINKYKKNESS